MNGEPAGVRTHGDSQDVRELIGFCLSEAVSCIGDKNYRHHELSLRVNQLVERLPGGRDRQPAPHQHAIDVKEQPEARLRLREEPDTLPEANMGMALTGRLGGVSEHGPIRVQLEQLFHRSDATWTLSSFFPLSTYGPLATSGTITGNQTRPSAVFGSIPTKVC